MTPAYKVLAMLAYNETNLNDGAQLVAILAWAARLSSSKVTGALRALERRGLVEKVRRGGQGDVLWGLTDKGRPQALELMVELEKEGQ